MQLSTTTFIKIFSVFGTIINAVNASTKSLDPYVQPNCFTPINNYNEICQINFYCALLDNSSPNKQLMLSNPMIINNLDTPDCNSLFVTTNHNLNILSPCPLPQGNYLNSCTEISIKFIIEDYAQYCLFKATCQTFSNEFISNQLRLLPNTEINHLENIKGEILSAANLFFSKLNTVPNEDLRYSNFKAELTAGSASKLTPAVTALLIAPLKFIL